MALRPIDLISLTSFLKGRERSNDVGDAPDSLTLLPLSVTFRSAESSVVEKGQEMRMLLLGCLLTFPRVIAYNKDRGNMNPLPVPVILRQA
jgi:ABC-type uncharacterized transport system YnjBCD ATPase subunit